MNKTELEIFWKFLIVIALFIILVMFIVDSKNKDFKISELKGSATYICSASINAPFLYEKESLIGFQLNQNTTQEQLDKWIKEHPNTIISDGKICIGNDLRIEG